MCCSVEFGYRSAGGCDLLALRGYDHLGQKELLPYNPKDSAFSGEVNINALKPWLEFS